MIAFALWPLWLASCDGGELSQTSADPERDDRLFGWASDTLELRDVLSQQSAVGDAMQIRLLDRVQLYEQRAQPTGDVPEVENDVDPELLEKQCSLGYVD